MEVMACTGGLCQYPIKGFVGRSLDDILAIISNGFHYPTLHADCLIALIRSASSGVKVLTLERLRAESIKTYLYVETK